MKLSTRTRYGTRALLDLARHNGEEPVQLKDIARRQDISLHYLEHIIAPLVGAGIVRSIRGAHGGLCLARKPGEINLGEVVRLLEGATAPVDCVTNPSVCNSSPDCATRKVWQEMQKAIDKVLDSMTIQTLLERPEKDEFTALPPRNRV